MRTKNSQPTSQTRRSMLTAMAVAVPTLGLQVASSPGRANADDPKPMFMFVHIADDLKADPAAGTLRLVNVTQQVLYFSDRPSAWPGI